MFQRIGNKIILVYGGITIIAMLCLMWFYAIQQEKSTLVQNELTMGKVAESITAGLRSVMLAGYADIAEDYTQRLQEVPDILDFQIARVNGLAAFMDNTTIEKVNARIGEEEFYTRDEESSRRVYQVDNPYLQQVRETQKMVPIYQTSPEGEHQLVFLAPIVPEKDCSRCHGKDDNIRGFVKLTTSLSGVEAAIKETRDTALWVSVLMLAVILAATTLFVTRTVVNPIKNVTDAMVYASKGNLDQSVPIYGRDEIARMANSFNSMTTELQTTYKGLETEQDKLNTVIHSAREGIVVTDSDGVVVLTNPAVEEFLGKSETEIIDGGFLNILDDADQMLVYLENDDHQQAEIIEYNDRILSVKVARILSDDGHLTGSSALLRDITEEKRFEQKLIKISTTDGLTDLYNRRYLDQTLDKELKRARRYGHNLSIMMFDVDHFKIFNDTHGHDQGDRVLISIGQTMKDSVRNVDICCRYGGEEFLIILPDTDRTGGLILAERVRESIQNTLVDGLQVTVSIGVATYPVSDFEAHDAFIEAADSMLYVCKASGRNCVRHTHTEEEALLAQVKSAESTTS
ncbi:MAG: diguanylate cyclase [Halopseudomonas sp.]